MQRARGALVGLPIPVAILYLLSTVFNLLAYNQGDLSHTVGSSYAYLFGHGVDFYDYNATQAFVGNDYFPTTYIIFAVWMAPVKMIVSPGVQNGVWLSPAEVIWAKILLLLLFWATFIIVSKIAKQFFADRPTTQSTVRIAFLLSPIAAFGFNVFSQYDIIGVFFTSLGLLFYLRGDKWRFALFFALAASSKYFALIIFVPLVLLQFKKLHHIVLLGLVAISVLVIEAGFYVSNAAFRDHTLFSLVGGKVGGAGTQPLTILVVVIFVVGCIALWRYRPTPQMLGPVAVYSCIVAYGLMILAVLWHPQWFIIITPFFALAVGYLRRPARFLVWESIFFLAFVWIIVNTWVANVDVTMVNQGALKDVFGPPLLYYSEILPVAAVPALSFLVPFYLLSPLAFLLIERVRPPAVVLDDGRKVPWGVWALRAATVPLVWTLPVIVSIVIPPALAEEVHVGASTRAFYPSAACTAVNTPYGELVDGLGLQQTFTAPAAQLTAITFPLATYGRPASGELTVKVLDSDGKNVAEKSIDLSTVRDNSDFYFVFPSLDNEIDDEFTVDLSTSGSSPGHGFAVWGAADDCDPNGTLTLDDVVQAGDIMLTTFYDQR